MNFLFENILSSDSEAYKVILNGKDIGCVFKDKDKRLWAAIRPDSQLRESEIFVDKESAAQHLALKFGMK